MILRVYAVYDEPVGAFLQPFMCRSDGEATRMFIQSVVSNDQFSQHAKDYSLAYLCEFNDVTGEYGKAPEDAVAVPRFILTGVQARHLASKQLPLPFGREHPEPVPFGDTPLAMDGSEC